MFAQAASARVATQFASALPAALASRRRSSESRGWCPPGLDSHNVEDASSSRPGGAPAPFLFRVVAKRSAKKAMARKLDKRDDVRDMQKMISDRVAAEEAEASYRPEPPPAPRDPADAARRILAAQGTFQEVLARMKDVKQAAMDSGRFSSVSGYKAFPEVAVVVKDLGVAKSAVYEAHLERAVALLVQAKGEPPANLSKFDWVYQKGVSGGNVRCLSFMLAACHKANVIPGMMEVLRVALENEAVAVVDEKILARAVATLVDLDEMGLLDEGEPQLLAAVRDAMAAAVAAAAAADAAAAFAVDAEAEAAFEKNFGN